MQWVKQGVVFSLNDSPNRSNHCQVPTPYVFREFIRVYYACRNNGKSFPAFFDLAKDLKTILRVNEKPVMNPGEPGMFDYDGVMPGCVIPHDDELWMYYTGWNELSGKARYHNAIGLAVSTDGGQSFSRKFDGPIIDKTRYQPGMAVTPFVVKERFIHSSANPLGEFSYTIFYASGIDWKLTDGKYEPTYGLRRSHCFEGTEFYERSSTLLIDMNSPLEAIAHPCVVNHDGKWHLWYCTRNVSDYRGGQGAYRIKHIAMPDGYSGAPIFPREDEEEVFASGATGEFDSDMQCYPYVFKCDGKLLMLYNGNGFGQTGIGLAICQ